MFPDKIGSFELLKALISGTSVNDSKRIAKVFEVFLQKSRLGLPDNPQIPPLQKYTTEGVDLSRLKESFNSNVRPYDFKNTIKALNSIKSKSESEIQKQIDQYKNNIPRSIPLLANRAAEKHGVPKSLFRKMIWIESEFNSGAVSPKGAMGLGQLMPDTARELGLRVGPDKNEGSVWHPESNLDAAARYMKWLHTQFVKKGIEAEEAWKFSAAAYNAGIGNISKAINRAEGEGVTKWANVAQKLPEVTGRSSRETLNYLVRLNVKI